METVASVAEDLGLIQVLDRAISFYPIMGPVLLTVPVVWQTKESGRAGAAHASGKITLHVGLKAHPGEVEATFLHEVAHMIQHFRYGQMDHGATWHEAMYQLGQKPIRCHSLGRLKAPPVNLEDLGL